jgi:hypothetical protein
MLAGVRWLLALTLFGACGFSVPSHQTDAGPDTPDAPPDTIVVKWAVDATSGKAVPANAVEWTDFLKAYGLANLSAPSGLWLLQEPSGALVDSVGTVVLTPFGGPLYQQPVAGWSRKGVATLDGMTMGFSNIGDASLPNMQTASMTVLALVELPGPAPLGTRNLLIALATLSTAGVGTMDPGTTAAPVLLKVDVTHTQHHVVTRSETIVKSFTALGSSRGLFIGGASSPAPLGRWLYVAAWYGTKAEISDADAAKLLTSLGW